MKTLCIDFDDTLVGYKKYGEPGEWLPGARRFLKKERRAGTHIIIHSCRANWAKGREEIIDTLTRAGFKLGPRLTVEGKPFADWYIDDKAVPFKGDWRDVHAR